MSADTPIKSVCFLCTGNICRSAMAHYFFEHEIQAAGVECEVFSRGLQAMTGWSATDEAEAVLSKRFGIDMSHHIAQQFTDYVLI
ncbi:hypothetical protein KIPB_002920 [Kipferlia bialata]|uniref:Phosphotyrosine protein phosphatase I domain-containing protein n=1 Tax=Kipferlia bialata TaxID=797122 RepID=A0A9K3GGL0_9EUKA|nr:hypothetical protein KIPB_002920 [Kipferlia bialata]|eukprot:g2920.t1